MSAGTVFRLARCERCGADRYHTPDALPVTAATVYSCNVCKHTRKVPAR